MGIEALIGRIAQGDRAAWGEIYQLYKNQVLGLCLGILRDKEEAMDAVQETFLKVFDKAATINPDGNFRAWLLKIAANTCRAKLRKSRNRDSWLKRWIIGKLADWNRNEVEEGVERELLSQAIKEALDELEGKYRIPLVLKFYAGMDYEEISRVLTELERDEITKGTVGSRINRGKAKLKERLLEKGVHRVRI